MSALQFEAPFEELVSTGMNYVYYKNHKIV